MPFGWVAAGAAVLGAVNGMNSANDQKDAEANAQKISQDQYNQTRADQAPYRDAGYTALGQLTAGTAPGGQYSKTFSGLGDLSDDPGYQFRMDQGMRGVDAGAAARGGVLSGAALKEEQRYGQDYASGEYNNAFNRYTTQQTNSFNRLASVAGLGQTAANQTQAAGQANATAQTDAVIGSANANAAGMGAVSSSLTSGANSLANWYQQQQYLSKLGTTPSSGYSTSGTGTPSGYLPASDPSWASYTGG